MIRSAIAFALLACNASALDVPFLSGRVNDTAGLLTPTDTARLERTLTEFEQSGSGQFAVLTIASLEGEPLEDFALKVARTWQLGRKGKNDGILLLVSRDDRKLRIEVGHGLEGTLPDALCGRIIQNVIVPHFREGDYSTGISEGANAVVDIVQGRSPPVMDEDASLRSTEMGLGLRLFVGLIIIIFLGVFEFFGSIAPAPGGWFFYFFLIPFWGTFPSMLLGGYGALFLVLVHIIGFPILRFFVGKSTWGQTLTTRMTTGGGRSSGFGGFSGGGGGFSGGGGSFGGGGASGSW